MCLATAQTRTNNSRTAGLQFQDFQGFSRTYAFFQDFPGPGIQNNKISGLSRICTNPGNTSRWHSVQCMGYSQYHQHWLPAYVTYSFLCSLPSASDTAAAAAAHPRSSGNVKALPRTHNDYLLHNIGIHHTHTLINSIRLPSVCINWMKITHYWLADTKDIHHVNNHHRFSHNKFRK